MNIKACCCCYEKQTKQDQFPDGIGGIAKQEKDIFRCIDCIPENGFDDGVLNMVY